MKVYFVESGKWEEFEYLGIFSTSDKAKDFIVKRWNRHKEDNRIDEFDDRMWIKVFELDNPDKEYEEIDFDYGYEEWKFEP